MTLLAGIYPQSVLQAVNDSGVSVGSHYDNGVPPPPGQLGLLVQSNGTAVDLGDLGNVDCYGRGINDSGVVVGSDSFVSQDAWVDFNQTAAGVTPLNTLLFPGQGTGWTLQMAYGIDSNGDIALRSKNPSGSNEGSLLSPVIPGDANLDVRVDINDLTFVLAHYNQSGGWAQGEFTGSGKVDINDLTIVLANYNSTSGASASSLAAVPEPCALTLLAAGLVGLLACAWRKRR